MEKVKVLITGPVQNDFASLTAKLTSLQKSKAGPFNVCFCVGPFFGSKNKISNDTNDTNETNDTNKENDENENGDTQKAKTFLSQGAPIPVYFCDAGLIPPGIQLPSYEVHSDDVKDEAEISLDDENDNDNDDENKEETKGKDDNENQESLMPKGVVKIAPNVYHLHGISFESSQTADILSINIPEGNDKNYLTVAFLPPNIRLGTPQTSKFQSKVNHPSYVGCDILLTSEWGQGMAGSTSCLSNDDKVKLQERYGADCSMNEIGSFDVAEITSQCRPRYHFAPSALDIGNDNDNGPNGKGYDASFFLQSLPYANPPSALSSGVMKNYHTSRFIALCQVVDSKMAKMGGKPKKFIHALGIQPLWSMDRVTATAIPENTVVAPCPYTDEGYGKDDFHASAGGSIGRGTSTERNMGLSEAQTRRLLCEENSSDQYRWNIRNRKRPLNNSTTDNIDPTNCTLFLHGLHKDVSRGANLNRGSIMNVFQTHGCTRVRYPGNDFDMAAQGRQHSYCFLEFSTHLEASQCLAKMGGMVEISGVGLALKWSSGTNRMNVPPPPPPGFEGVMMPSAKRQKSRLTEAEASDSSCLFIHLKPMSWSEEEYDSAITRIGNLAQTKLEDAINGDGGSERVTAEEEPALKVSARKLTSKPHCGFLDFASHAAASMGLATLTGSTDGGDLLEDLDKDQKLEDIFKDAQLWWGKPQQTGEKDHLNKIRHHRSQLDKRTDCWFCLASPTCEKHLIVCIDDSSYVTMPKGAVNNSHTLIVPINHSSSDDPEDSKKKQIIGAFLDPDPKVVAEIEETKEKIRKHANNELQKDLFVFERAIPTKGGYHAHINCIPIERGLGPKIKSAMLSMAAAKSKYGEGFELREIQNPDMSINTILKNDDDLGGYFYAEIPFEGNTDIKRFLYKCDMKDTTTKSVPLQFGREVLASVLGDPNLGSWKTCVLTKEQEEENTNDYRKSYA